MRSKFELEYNLNCSPKVLFSRLSTPEGLGEWFADEVNVDGDIFTFFWNNSESKARLSALKENKMVRFEWLGMENEESNFFEFRINLAPSIIKLHNGIIICSLDFCSQCVNFIGVRELAPSGHRFFGYFLLIKKKKVTCIWASKRTDRRELGEAK